MAYTILLDGERVARLSSDESVRAWIAKYREELKIPTSTQRKVLD